MLFRKPCDVALGYTPDHTMSQGIQQSSRPRSLPPITATLWRTNVPDIPIYLPCRATLIVESGLHVKCEGPNFDGVVSFDLNWSLEDLKEIRVRIMPDIGDEIEAQWIRDEDMSVAIVRHVDPYGVIPFFETAFQSLQGYWFRALAKRLSDMGVAVAIEEGTRPGRKRAIPRTHD